MIRAAGVLKTGTRNIKGRFSKLTTKRSDDIIESLDVAGYKQRKTMLDGDPLVC